MFKTIFKYLIFGCLLFISLHASAQVMVPFQARNGNGQASIALKGDYTIIANGVLNRRTNFDNPNVPYNGILNNNDFYMDHIDIDSDPSTFNSSSSTLNLPSCSRIVYAGLYWGGYYKQEVLSNPIASFKPVDANRLDVTTMKFRVPGGNYVDIVADNNPDPAGQEDQIIIDDPKSNQAPYVCYKNVTQLLQGLANPNGDYTGANIRAEVGGSNSGWSLVVIYENPTLSSKYISIFDGYASVTTNPGANSLNIPISGFRTTPNGPVSARLGVGGIEGDRVNDGDFFSISTPQNPNFTPLGQLPTNPSNNFFNSTISVDGQNVNARNPNGSNALGFDLDIFNMANPNNTVIGNNETQATIQISTQSEWFASFLVAFGVEVIEPEIPVRKRVTSQNGTDITGQGVNLGDNINYTLSFQNIGNDDATGLTPGSSTVFESEFIIRDVLPPNVILDENNLVLPQGVTYIFDPNSNEIVFAIPDNLVTVGAAEQTITMPVQVSPDCLNFLNACSQTIVNQAFSTFSGKTSGTIITNDPSITSSDMCGFNTVGTTNFLLDDISSCTFESEVQLCGQNVQLQAGQGFNSYDWFSDINGNGQLDPGDLPFDDGDPDNDPSTLLVDSIGTYFVNKIASAPCVDATETIKVTPFGNAPISPIVDFFNDRNNDADPNNDVQGEIVICPNDGEMLPQFFLCGANDSERIQVNITNAASLEWQLLDDTSCAAPPNDCANKNLGCIWNTLNTGSSFDVMAAGNYRLVVNYQGGCFSLFYFDVFQNNLGLMARSQNILCDTPGFIEITNVGNNYGYQLIDNTNGNTIVPFSAGQGPRFNFNPGQSGVYRVEVAQLNSSGNPIPGSCIFSTAPIGIAEPQLDLVVTTTDETCNTAGAIRVEVANISQSYTYELWLNDGTPAPTLTNPDPYQGQHPGGILIDTDNANSSNTHTFSANQGDYNVVVRTNDGCVGVASTMVVKVPDPTLSAQVTNDIGCNDGQITLTATGGNPSIYNYAIYSKDGVNLYPNNPNGSPNIPASAFQNGPAGNVFSFSAGEAGVYEFAVVDANNCYAISNTATLVDNGPMSITPTTNGALCSNSNSATLTIAVSGGLPPFRYSIDGGNTFQTNDNAFPNLSSGLYQIQVEDGSGCLVTQDFRIDEPNFLSASAAVVGLVECTPGDTAEVRITNAQGGTMPYTYSFNAGNTYGSSPIGQLLPGNHTVLVRDDLGCTFAMDVTVEPAPTPPNLTADIVYECDGEATVTIMADNPNYNYTYNINGNANVNTPQNVFTNVIPGNHTVSVDYVNSTQPPPSVLLEESFGSGPPSTSANVGSNYCYEPFDGTTSPCNNSSNGLIGGEYSVVSSNDFLNPYFKWTVPNDPTGTTNGRYLAIDISSVVGLNGIIYAKRGVEIIPNSDVTVSMQLFNLFSAAYTSSEVDPNLTIELVDNNGLVIASQTTGLIPRNQNADDWYNSSISLNPGANSMIDIVIRTNVNTDNGNDLVVDNILAIQRPMQCSIRADFDFTVDDNRAFSATLDAFTDISCNGDDNGTITFSVGNFGAGGFQYAVDGGNFTAPQNSPITVTVNNLSAGTHSIVVRDADNNNCLETLTQSISEPSPVSVNATLVQQANCNTTASAIIDASASGGIPGYDYQLEDGANPGTPITGRDYNTNGSNTRFDNLSPGDYIVKARDRNNCEAEMGITIDPPEDLMFTVTASTCYDGNNNGSITVTANQGNGNYQFKIGRTAGNTALWQTPNPTTADNFTFNGLSNGRYFIDVRDGAGCTAAQQFVDIQDQVLANVQVMDVSGCADGSIMVTASGGDGSYTYAFVPANNPASGFGTNNTFTVTNANAQTFDVYVRDGNGCEFLQEDIIVAPADPLIVAATATDPECHDGFGGITVAVTGGRAPFTYTLVDLSPADGIDFGQNFSNVTPTNYTFQGIGVGNYRVEITDVNGCTNMATASINNATEITADIMGITPATCGAIDPNDYGFRFTNVTAPSGGTLEYSDDNGANWVPTTDFTGYSPGTSVFPSIRVVYASGAICQMDFDRFTIPFPLDDLDITTNTVVQNCTDLEVTVLGSQGNPPYDYTYTDDPANFDSTLPFLVNNIPSGTSHTFTNLQPGRTYTFYVKDNIGCIRQSNENVNVLTPPPIDIDPAVAPSCNGANDGTIEFNLNPTTTSTHMQWQLYEVGTNNTVGPASGNVIYSNTIVVNNVPPGEYYITVEQTDGSGTTNCVSSSENVLVRELNPVTANRTAVRDISCSLPGLISIDNIQGGGGGPYTFDVTGPAGFISLSGHRNNPIQIPANSPAGDYTVTVIDSNGCSVVLAPVTLQLTPDPIINTIVQDNCAAPISVTVTATGTGLGYAMVTANDPAPSTFFNNNGQFTNVAPGTYDFYIIDDNGCTHLQEDYVVHPILEVQAELTKLIDCTSNPDAEITVTISNGSGTPYGYEVFYNGSASVPRTPVASTPFTISASAAGDYTIIVYDDKNNADPTDDCSRQLVVNVPLRLEPVFDHVATDVSCNGANDGSIALSAVDNGILPLIYSINAAVGTYTFNATTNTFEGLAQGTYRITAEGSNDCTSISVDIVIDEPTPITGIVPTVQNFECANGNNPRNASISVAGMSGGSSNYVLFEFIDTATGNVLQANSSSIYIETDPMGGNYTINVYDDQGCFGTTTASILPYDELIDATAVITRPLSCNPGNDAEITINVTSALNDPNSIEYSDDNGLSYQNSNVFAGLGTGTHRFLVRHKDTGCILNVQETITDPNNSTVDVIKLGDVVCFGTDSGQITVELVDANYNGAFTYRIIDNNGTPAVGDDQLVANGNGTANTVTPVINLGAGSYFVEVTQVLHPNCSNQQAFTINGPNSDITASVNVTPLSCNNNDGAINIVGTSGGWGNYTYYVGTTPPSFAADYGNMPRAENLPAGVYEAWVRDGTGCERLIQNNIRLETPDDITATISSTPVSCFNGNDGSVTATITGSRTNPANPSYLYRLNGYDDLAGSNLVSSGSPRSTNTFTGLRSGFYSITITDDVNCSFETQIIEITNPTPVEVLLVRTSPLTCTTGPTFELSATGGSGNYEYSDDNITFTPMVGNRVNLPVSGLFGAGTYQYFVRDANNGCAAVASNTIIEKPIETLTLDVDSSAAFINCNNESTASIYASSTGGLGDYMYELYSNYNGSTLNIGDLLDGPKPQGEFTNLGPGTYWVNVRSEDCTAEPQMVDIANPQPLVVDFDSTDILCNGEESGTITVNLSGGAGGYQYSISPRLDQFDSVNTFTDLAAGSYTVIAQDQNGCFEELIFEIREPAPLEVVAANVVHEQCEGQDGGLIEIDIVGGTAPYSAALNSNNDADFVDSQTLFDNLGSGTHLIFVRDAQGCEDNITVTVDPGVDLSAIVEPVYGCDDDRPNNYINIVLNDDSISNEVLYGLDTQNPNVMQLNPFFRDVPPGSHFIAISHANGCLQTYNFEITDFEPLAVSLEQTNINEITATVTGGKEAYTIYFGGVNNGTDNAFRVKRTDTYTVTVVDQNGCEATAEIFIEFIDIEIPNFFTPDGDGLNDRWLPRNTEQFSDIVIKIYDRYGRVIYLMENPPLDGWGGSYNDKKLPTGDYWYTINLNDDEDSREFVGHFTLYR